MAGGLKSGARGGGKSRSGPRPLILLILAGFFVVAIGVIARRTFGISQAAGLRLLESRRDSVLAARGKLEAEIREAASRARLVPIAERRLQMKVPSDSQVIILPRPPK